MTVPVDVVLKVDREIGSPGRPQTIIAQGEVIDTGCVEWTLPEDTVGVWGILTKYRELSTRYREIRQNDPADPALAELQREVQQLFSPYKPHKLPGGTTVYDIEDLAGGDPRAMLHSMLWRVRALLADDPVSAYLGPHQEGMNSELLLVAPTRDQFDILRRLRTDATNYGLDTEGVIEKLREIDASLGIDIVSAGMDSVEFLLLRPPKGDAVTRWSQWLRRFCPDVSQPRKNLRAGRVLLWWD